VVTLANHSWYWAAIVNCSHRKLLEGLFCFAEENRQVILEGGIKEAVELLTPISVKPALEVESGSFSLRKPQFIAVPVIAINLEALLRIEQQHGPLTFSHCVLISASEILVEAYDAGSSEISLSPLLSSTELENFAHVMGVELERRELS
jgi:hypothetical protein